MQMQAETKEKITLKMQDQYYAQISTINRIITWRGTVVEYSTIRIRK